jgi:hypothetical protein
MCLFAGVMMTVQAQRFSAGLLSGAGFSDYHGSTSSGKWESQTGMLSGVFVRYALSPVIGVGTELNYTTQGYYYKPYKYNAGYPYYPNPMSSSLRLHGMIYLPVWERWDLSFWRVPIFLTFSTPTRLQFSFSAGLYFSFTGKEDYSTNGYQPYPWYRDPYYPMPSVEDDVPEHDFGLMYAASLSYPVGSDFSLFAQGRYFIGHRPFINGYGRTGASEVAMGFAYTGLFRSKNDKAPRQQDTLLSRLQIIPRFGVSISRFRNSSYPDSYNPRAAVSPSLWLEYSLGNSFSLLSGLGYERKGYHLRDSTSVFYMHALSSWPGYDADTRVDLDYAILPLLLKLAFGKGVRVYFTGGPYLGLKLNARVTGTADYESSSSSGYTLTRTDVYDDIEGDIKNTDWGWMYGAGTEIPMNQGYKFEFGIQVASGRSNILENELLGDAYPESEDAIHNGTLTFYVGLTIPIHKSN